MRVLIAIVVGCCLALSCKTNKEGTPSTNERELAQKFSDTVKIANEEAEYEIIIIEPGFNAWLQSIARPEGYYSQNFLENRNRQYVINWNLRVNQPLQFNPDLYVWQIDYDPNVDYGYEVNYKLYNYFIYFQLTYKQQLGVWIPRI